MTKFQKSIREPFIEPKKIYNDVATLLSKLQHVDFPDFLTFVANGEPTLDLNLGKTIRLLKEFRIPIAVITNASLLFDVQVREDLFQADWVSLKVDSAIPGVRKRINRPFPAFSFYDYCEGLTRFSSLYEGVLVSETMLVEGVNDMKESLEKTATLIKTLNPEKSYISIPIRPPALNTVRLPEEETINRAYQIYHEKGLNAELLVAFEGVNTGCTGNAKDDILNMCVVHPIREETMSEIVKKDGADYYIVEKLIGSGQIKRVDYKGKMFYLRNFSK
ncbi:MAG: radical SAM protein [Bacteroidales bacterium]|nr:radical SAM protein [Bacteroidales bacterium]